MSAAVPSAAEPTTPHVAVSRPVRLVRVAVLLIAGLAIAFSATMHERLGFDLGITAAALGGIGVAHLIEWVARRSKSPSSLPLMLGIVAIAAAVIVPFTASAIGFAVLIAAWSLVSALLEFIGGVVQPGSRQDSTLLGASGVLLALLALLVREDPVAVLGFFGAYAVLNGVFLGISAFDTRRATAAAQPAADAR
ncbi:DUF308 domain-containing protein [Leucobacter chironomi]|uniref:DUF308 domain-containing protein n=1 Tax=Leucobacter chironomi TaxID=491918 RepID=UPI00040618A0|nr:DUF308 domain-containing protein [Leucobacter chironomi]